LCSGTLRRGKLISERGAAAAATGETPGPPEDSQLAESPDDGGLPDAADAEPSGSAARMGLLIGVVGIVLVGAVTMMMKEPDEPSEPLVAPVLQLRDIPDRSLKEGQSLSVTAELSGVPADANDARFRLDGQIPDGMTIDARTGRITWTPAEQQGPGEYRVMATAVASTSQGELRDSETFTITVEEVNQAPWIVPIAPQKIDMEENDTLRLKVEASDPDLPPGQLTYRLATGCPDGVRIDAQTGQLTWTPTAEQRGREHVITVCVRDEGPEARSDQTSFTVKVTAIDAWKTMAKRVAPAVCLLVAVDPETDAAYPYGCACAIRNDALLTSGVLALELQKRRAADWLIRANWPEQGRMLNVREIKVHRAFTATADTPQEQIYWDLAVLTVEGNIADVAELAAARDLTELEQGMPLGCLAIAHNAEPLTRFDTPAVELTQLKLLDHYTLTTPDGAAQPGAPRLLCLSGSLPDKIHGSPIVNEAGKIVGVYAEKAERSDKKATQPSNIHYASETVLVRAWLAGQATEHWIAPQWQNDH